MKFREDITDNGKAGLKHPQKQGAECPQNSLRIKICGLSRPEDITYVNEALPDYCGFIINFPKSHRNVSPDRVRSLVKGLDKRICPVGVFVNQPMETVLSLALDGTLGAVQLHGNETQEYVEELKRRLVAGAGIASASRREEAENASDQEPGAERTLPVPVRADTGSAAALGTAGRRILVIQAFSVRTEEDISRARESAADYILLDRGTGTGQTFDWDLVQEVNRPFFLAGGLGPENLAEAAARLHPFAVDMSSGVETEKVKDREKILRAVEIAHGRI